MRWEKDFKSDKDWIALHDPRYPKSSAQLRRDVVKVQRMIADWTERVSKCTPKFRQARHLIEKFGGIVPFSLALDTDPDTVLKRFLNEPLSVKNAGYTVKICNNGHGKEKSSTEGKPHSKATDGILPFEVIAHLVVIARHWGILLTAHDIYPELFNADDEIDITTPREEIRRWLKQILPPSVRSRAYEDMIASSLSTLD